MLSTIGCSSRKRVSPRVGTERYGNRRILIIEVELGNVFGILVQWEFGKGIRPWNVGIRGVNWWRCGIDGKEEVWGAWVEMDGLD